MPVSRTSKNVAPHVADRSAVALVFPVGLGLLIAFFGRGLNGWALPLGTLAGGILLVLELLPVINWLGDVFERIDVNEVTAGT